ncbi:MAG: ribulose-phosphate 3-epimerase [Oscillospiraceae bacterium]|nr:ribulose-phosphate 3-epimerase [Oscillospiraceae bacterium]
MELPTFSIEPSVICCDLCNLETEVHRWEEAGVRALHIDVLDGAFAPSLPVGIDTFQQLSRKTKLPFDVHVMSQNNEWFISECIKMNAARICFQLEGERHPEERIRQIRSAGIAAGLAFSPETPVEEAGDLLKEIDFILLMRIKPGYAGFAQEEIQVDMDKKISDARKQLDSIKPGMDIVVDGRVAFEDIFRLRELGATTFVGGSRSLFKTPDYKTNYKKAVEMYQR